MTGWEAYPTWEVSLGDGPVDAVGAFEREGKDGVDWALHLTGGMVEKCLRSVSVLLVAGVS
jgi:hypothetical protein